MSIEIFEPPMCCSTGVCGPVVDPVGAAALGVMFDNPLVAGSGLLSAM